MSSSNKISLCMVAQDDEHQIGSCLESAARFVDEIIVTDTGSTDETPKIAQAFGSKWSFFEWSDDVSIARNESIRHAQGGWIFWMNPNETISESDGLKLRQLIETNHDEEVLAYALAIHSEASKFGFPQQVRLFQNQKDLQFEGRVLGKVIPSIRRQGGKVIQANICVCKRDKDDYSNTRTERELCILRKQQKELKQSDVAWFDLATSHLMAGKYDDALESVDRFIELANPVHENIATAYVIQTNCLFEVGRLDEAVITCRRGIQLQADNPDLLFWQGRILHKQDQYKESIEYYEKAISTSSKYSAQRIETLCIPKEEYRFRLALALQAAGRLNHAEAQCRQLLDTIACDLLARRMLIEILTDQKRFTTADVECESMQGSRETRMDGTLLQAQVFVKQGLLVRAQECFESCRSEFSNQQRVMSEYANFCLDNGKVDDAQELYEQLVDEFPSDASALKNLGSINLQKLNYDSAIGYLNESLRYRPKADETNKMLATAIDARDRKEKIATPSRTASKNNARNSGQKRVLNFEFRESLNDCAMLARVMAASNFEFEIECEPEYAFLFESVKATVVEEAETELSWSEPPDFVSSRCVKPWHINKAGWNFVCDQFSIQGSPRDIWMAVTGWEGSIDPPNNSSYANYTMEKLLENMPLPIVLIDLRFQIISKSPEWSAFSLEGFCEEMLTRFDGSLLVIGQLENAGKHPNRFRCVNDFVSDISTEFLLSLIRHAGLLVSSTTNTLGLATLTQTPTVGLWSNDQYPARYSFPRVQQLNIVTQDSTKDRNRIWRIPWNIVEHPESKFSARLLADQCDSMLRQPRFLSENRKASDVQFGQLVGWCHEDKEILRDRNRSLDVLFREIKCRLQNPTIIETGTIRADEDWAGAGFFTYLASAYVYHEGGTVFSVDIDPKTCNFSTEICQAFGSIVNVVCRDSVEFLMEFNDPIDVLYLDSLDTYEPRFAEHALDEAKAAFPKLHQDSIVVFDDSPTIDRSITGKGALAVPWLMDRGWKKTFAGYQVVLTFDQSAFRSEH